MLRFLLFICTLFLFSSCGTSYSELIEKGNTHYSNDEPKLSERFYKKAYNKDPFKTEASYKLGKVLSKDIQTFDEATFFFEDALKKEKSMYKRCDFLLERNKHLARYINSLTRDKYRLINSKKHYKAVYMLDDILSSPNAYGCPTNDPSTYIDHPLRIRLYASMSAFDDDKIADALRYLYDIDFNNLHVDDQDDYILHATKVLSANRSIDEIFLFAEQFREVAQHDTVLMNMLGEVYSQLIEDMFSSREFESIQLILNSGHLDSYMDVTQLIEYYFRMSKILINQLSYSKTIEADVTNIRNLLTKTGHSSNLKLLYNDLMPILRTEEDFIRLKKYVELAASDLKIDVSNIYFEDHYKVALYGIAQQAFNANKYENAAYYLNIYLSIYPDDAAGNSLRQEVMKLLGRSMLEIGASNLAKSNLQNAHDSYVCAMGKSEDLDKKAHYGLYKTFKQSYRIREAYKHLTKYRAYFRYSFEQASIIYEQAALSSIMGEIPVALIHLNELRRLDEYDEYRRKGRYDNDLYNLSEEDEFKRWLAATMRKKLVIYSLTDIYGMDIGSGSSDPFLVIEFDGKKLISETYDNKKNLYFEPLEIVADLPKFVNIFVWDYDDPDLPQKNKGNELILSLQLNTLTNRPTASYQKCDISMSVDDTYEEVSKNGLSFTRRDYSLYQSDFYLGTKGCWQIGFEALYELIKLGLGPVGYAMVTTIEIIASGKNGPDLNQISSETQKIIAKKYPDNVLLKYFKNATVVRLLFKTYDELKTNNCL